MPVPTTTCPLNFWPSLLKAAAFSSTTMTSCPSESRSFASAEPTRPHPTMRYLMNNEARSEVSGLYPGRGRPERTVKEGSTVLQNLSKLIGAWLSLVERFVRDEEVARS